MKDAVISALKKVFDPEIPVNIWDLGLVYDVSVDAGKVELKMTMTSPTCPMAEDIMENARTEIAKIDGIAEINIDLVWDPPWDLSRMSDAARIELDLTGMGW
ncbi:MAG: iron-sulfur cluster assembly protein [Rickettsiales bacterium]|jgi:FeS assembly SUF system protein|nr:iron-sulfur cluster assembly protein [Rickettsiales bacterium]